MRTKHLTTLFAAMTCLALTACGGGSGGDKPPPVVTFKLTVTPAGNGAGTITGGTIDCGTTCTATVDTGTIVTLTAAANAAKGSTFAGWGGACTNKTGTCKVTMSDNKTVTATFLGRRLALTPAGDGGGTVTFDPAGLSCGAGCTAFEDGAAVTLTAHPTPDSTFTGFGGDCTGTTCTVTMSAARAVTATFAFQAPVDDTCYLPAAFEWTSTDPLAQPTAPYISLKDFTDVVYNGKHVVYMSDVTPNAATPTTKGDYGANMMVFDDWSGMASATQVPVVPAVVAPTLFYFAPKNTWILAYQWGGTQFSYRTSTDPTSATGWSSEHPLYATSHKPEAQYDAIDQTVICDATDCYLFFAGDNGRIYRSSMPIGSFPGTFDAAKTIMTEASNELFEAVQVYTVKGTGQYLMIVECIGVGSNRYFRAFTATSLGGDWTPITVGESHPFAGKANVNVGGTLWTSSISHGDLVRENPDQTFTIDACKLQLLYQGYATGWSTNPYDLIPWRPGLLTLKPRGVQ
jgi:endo-1,4-beta-xylanase